MKPSLKSTAPETDGFEARQTKQRGLTTVTSQNWKLPQLAAGRRCLHHLGSGTADSHFSTSGLNKRLKQVSRTLG